MQKTLGGDQLGRGKKMKVDLHGYERSTHDMGYLWRSTMAAGTLVPFIKEVALPGDSFDIDLNTEILTHPTVGPLFGSMKVQLDVFQAPIRLYQGQLHNNKLGIGMNMSAIKLPIIPLKALPFPHDGEIVLTPTDMDNSQINPSALLSYLDIRGVGIVPTAGETETRNFNGVPFLAYWDIYKNYYANKQEEIGAMIFTPPVELIETIDNIDINGSLIGSGIILVTTPLPMGIVYTGTRPRLEQVIIQTSTGEYPLNTVMEITSETTGSILGYWKWYNTGNVEVTGWRYITEGELPITGIRVQTFPLETLDGMREAILQQVTTTTPFNIYDNSTTDSPYYLLLNWEGDASPYLATQQGLALKSYQSDLFNNWLSTEWINGAGGINDVTKISTVSGSFTIDEFQLHKKVYDMLNRIAVSGGSYDDWLDAVYTENRYNRAESPIYHGGLIKELIFQEVVSNSESSGDNGAVQPLGTLAGRGRLAGKHKGGKIKINVEEPSYIMAIASITPRLDYSQGNKWDTSLETMDDLHKPALDQIGFQELIEEQMAWWTTRTVDGTTWTKVSAGLQPAWINYMTNVNQVRGNFAIPNNEMFMTLNRKYEFAYNEIGITDMTTYIDPEKFNHIFAQTSLDAQNYWVQIAVDMIVRRKLSAKIMPNL